MSFSHAGTKLSFLAWLLEDGKTISIKLKDGEEISWKIKGRRKIQLFCPSVEGDVLICFFRNNEEKLYDTRSGAELSNDEIRTRNPHFYS